MGAGYHGGFGATKGSAKIYKDGYQKSQDKEYTREQLIDFLDGKTAQSSVIADKIRKGEIKLSVLGDELFERAFGVNSDVVGIAIDNKIYLRKNSSTIHSDMVHEGTHAIDFLKGMLDYEKSLGKTSMRKLILKGGDLQVLQFNTEDMKKKKELILLRITGEDRPGLTAGFMEILARYGADVMDIGQADIHNTLSLGIMIYVDEQSSGQVMKHVLFKASELGVTVHFAPVSEEEYNAWVGRQGKNRSILTVLGRRLEARQIEAVTKIIARQGLNIDSIRRLTGRPPLHEDRDSAKACIEFSVRGTPNDKALLHEELMRLSSEMAVDFSYQKDDMYRRMRRLICFDMDSTLIQTECIDELAERNGVGPQVRAITESAMRGEIDFRESFTRRVALLKGLDVSVMQDIAEHLPMTEGVERLMT